MNKNKGGAMKTIKNLKKGVIASIGGISLTLFLVILLQIQYGNQLKIKYALQSFKANSPYSLVARETKKLEKKRLFQNQDTFYYGYGIEKVFISHNGIFIPLQKALQENKINLSRLLKQFTLTKDLENVKTYENEKYRIIVNTTLRNHKEVIFSTL